MGATDAHPVAIRNAILRITFPILDADGDLVTGASSLDSEFSEDGAGFADCSNEATEIATSSGMYLLDLIATETDGDTGGDTARRHLRRNATVDRYRLTRDVARSV